MTEDQTLLQDAAERYLRENYDFNKRRENITQGIYRDPEQWQAFADMGWLALPYPESLGGLEMGSRELAILAELCGRYLVTEPLIDSLAITSKVIAASDQAPDLVPAIAAGEIVPIACIDEMAGSRSVAPATRLERVESGWRLKGEKPWVSAGASATHFVVLASGADGLAWVVVASDAEGVQSDHFATHDGRGGTNCRFDIAINDAEILLTGRLAQLALEAYRELAMALSSAETLGASQAALDTTVDYTKQRVQFGQPLASFQALQHRMANMLIQIELTRSLVYAACNAADNDSADRARYARAAKVKASRVGREVTQEAIQLHGGIATTDEYIVGHFFKRITALESWVCSRGEALQEFMALDG
ncbi:MAG: acyl-CoA dehydrogenase [Luminiphilus sp.]|nr:acyl-CoA dehydrogenase [Luminiphilus sp.]